MTNENEVINAQAEWAKAQAARRAAQALAEIRLYDDASSRLYKPKIEEYLSAGQT